VIENSLAEEFRWSMKRVNERGSELADFALACWPLPPMAPAPNVK